MKTLTETDIINLNYDLQIYIQMPKNKTIQDVYNESTSDYDFQISDLQEVDVDNNIIVPHLHYCEPDDINDLIQFVAAYNANHCYNSGDGLMLQFVYGLI